MSDKHTPRPWFFEENEYMWQLFGGDGIMPLQLLKAPKKDTPYAEYWPKAADARLIVAAPDLLAELVAMYAVFYTEQCPQCGNGWTDEEMGVMSGGRVAVCGCGYEQAFKGAAITKAHGKPGATAERELPTD